MSSVSNGQAAQNGTTDQPLVVLHDDPRTGLLLVDVVEQEAAAGRREVAALGRVLAGRLDGQGRPGPDLAVRMGVRGAHRLAPVLEHLDPAERPPSSVGLVRPEVDDRADGSAATSGPASGRGGARSR